MGRGGGILSSENSTLYRGLVQIVTETLNTRFVVLIGSLCLKTFFLHLALLSLCIFSLKW